MGTIRLNVPGDEKLEYKIESTETVNQIINIIKIAEEKKRAKEKDPDIIGIWNDGYEETLTSEEIEKQWRERNWERY